MGRSPQLQATVEQQLWNERYSLLRVYQCDVRIIVSPGRDPFYTWKGDMTGGLVLVRSTTSTAAHSPPPSPRTLPSDLHPL